MTTAYVNLAAGMFDETWVSRLVAALEPTRGRADTVVILLAANGGNALAVDAVYSLLRGWPARIVTHATGPIYSAGLSVFLAGEERYATSTASFLFHSARWAPAAYASKGKALDEAALEGLLASLRIHNATQAQRLRERCTFEDPAEIDELLRSTPTARPLPWLVNRGIVHAVREVAIPADAQLISVQAPASEVGQP